MLLDKIFGTTDHFCRGRGMEIEIEHDKFEDVE